MSDQQGEAVETTQAPATGAETTQAEQTTTEQPDILGQINQRLDQFGQELPNLISQQFAEQQSYYEDDQQGYDQYGQQQQEQDPYGGLDPNDPVQAQLIQARNELNELKQGFQGTQRDMWSRDLEGVLGQYPEIRDNPEVAKAVMGNLSDMGFDVNSMVPPKALVTAFKAYRADQIAAQQQPLDQAQQSQVSLESSAAQQQQPEEDYAGQIKAAMPRGNFSFG